MWRHCLALGCIGINSEEHLSAKFLITGMLRRSGSVNIRENFDQKGVAGKILSQLRLGAVSGLSLGNDSPRLLFFGLFTLKSIVEIGGVKTGAEARFGGGILR